MPAPHTVPTFPFPIPSGGLNARDPLSAMDPTTSPWLVNVDPNNQELEFRGGYQRAFGPYTSGEFILYAEDISGAMYVLTLSANDSKLRVVDSSVSTQFTSSGTYSIVASRAVSSLKHAGNYYFLLTDETLRFDGSSWTAGAFTDSGSTDIHEIVATSFKGRPYIASADTIYFGDLGQVQGALDEWDVSELIEEGSIYWMGKLTSPGDRADETYLAFGTDTGRIFVYRGSWPESSDWEQVGVFNTSRPPAPNSILEYNNDLWLATQAGIISLRRLFQLGDEADDVFVTKAIEPFWKDILITAITAVSGNPTFTYPAVVAMAHQKDLNKVYVRVSGVRSVTGSVSTNGVTHFVYNASTGAWGMHTITGVVSDTYYNMAPSLTPLGQTIYYASDSYVMEYDADSYYDENSSTGAAVSYIGEIHSAYSSLGSTFKHKKIKTIEPILETDFAGSSVVVKAAGDFGRDVSDGSTQSLLDGYNLPTYNVGASGSYVQYRMEITSDSDSSDGFKLYAVNMGVRQ